MTSIRPLIAIAKVYHPDIPNTAYTLYKKEYITANSDA